MFTITIADDTADALFRDILVQDYRGLVKDIAALEDKGQLAGYEQDDLDSYRSYVHAMEILMKYYLSEQQMREVIDA